MQRHRQPPNILDHLGRPVNTWSRDYDAAWSDRVRKYVGSGNTRPEGEMLRQPDRARIIATLRRAVRNSTLVKAMLMRYALSIGCPTLHSETDDPLYNDLKEIFLERKFRRIGHGRKLSLRTLMTILCFERIIGGDVFVVFTKDGHLQLIPSEMCGSPENAPDNEYQGIQYDSEGAPVRYRFGKRIKNGSRHLTSISFEDADSTFVDAEWVRHIVKFDRIEEGRGSPELAPAVAAIQDLADITVSKVMQIKLQSAYSLFITKNMDPQILSEMIGMSDSATAGQIVNATMGRGDYQEITPGGILYGEIGEGIESISPNIQAQDFGEFERGRLYFICSVIGIPPEEAILGYGRSNYSSSRADKLRWKQVVEYDRAMLAEQMLDDAQQWLCQRAAAFNDLPPVPAGQSMEVNWTWPPLPAIDPMKEAQEDVLLMESGLESRSEIVGRRGRHYDTLDAQIVREAKSRAKMILEAAGENREPTVAEIRAEMPDRDRAAKALMSFSQISELDNSERTNNTNT